MKSSDHTDSCQQETEHGSVALRFDSRLLQYSAMVAAATATAGQVEGAVIHFNPGPSLSSTPSPYSAGWDVNGDANNDFNFDRNFAIGTSRFTSTTPGTPGYTTCVAFTSAEGVICTQFTYIPGNPGVVNNYTSTFVIQSDIRGFGLSGANKFVAGPVQLGDMIGAGNNFTTEGIVFTSFGSAQNGFALGTNYIGFKFDNNGTTNYGWAEISIGSLNVVQYAIENDGGQIQVGQTSSIPEPSAMSLLAAGAAGLAGYRRRRHGRN